MEHEHYIRLQRLLQLGRKVMENHLGSKWTDVLGSNMFGDIKAREAFFMKDPRGQKVFRKLSHDQKVTAIQREPSSWDISLLTFLLRSVPFKALADANPLNEIAAVRNDLAHRSSFHVNDSDFHKMWQRLVKALNHFDSGNSSTEIETIKTAPIYDLTGCDDNDRNARIAEELKERGNTMYAEHKYEEAALAFSDAIQVPNLSQRMLAILYSNRSMCYLKLSDATAAWNDANRCKQYQPNWHKSYARLGQAYDALGLPKKAIEQFDRALQLVDSSCVNNAAIVQIQNFKWSAMRRIILGQTQIPDRFEKRLWLPIPGQEHVEMGHALYYGTETMSKNVEKAIAEYKLGATLCNAEALYNLASALMDVPSALDFAAAHNLLLQAAGMPPTLDDEGISLKGMPRVGVDAAQCALGMSYHYGIYVSQDFPYAIEWYERAISNGDAFAANNLGSMYLGGHQGLERNFTKAEELFSLAYRRGELRAASNLAILYTRVQTPSKVKQWYEIAKSHGKMHRDQEDICTNFLSKYGSLSEESEKIFKITRPLMEALQQTHNFSTAGSPLFSTTALMQYASRGGGYAKTLLESHSAFSRAMDMLLNGSFDLFAFIDSFFLSLKLESSGITCKLAEGMVRQLRNTLEKFVNMQPSSNPDSDMKARLILAYLAGFMSTHSAMTNLNEAIRKYPSCPQYYGLRGCLYCFHNDFEAGLRDFNMLLKQSPSSYEFLYDRAVAMDHSRPQINNAHLQIRQIELVQQAYQEFLDRAPHDHRKVPAAYYAIATLYASLDRPSLKMAEEFRVKAIKAEQDQMHYFLPYNEGSGKRLLEMYGYLNGKGKKETNGETLECVVKKMADLMRDPASQINNDSKRLLSEYRRELIIKHRSAIASTFETKLKYTYTFTSSAPSQEYRRSLLGLKGVVLRDLDTSSDYVATGRVLTVTIIEPPVCLVGIHFVVADENEDAEKLAIYNLPGQFPSNCDKFYLGTEISIIEPYVRQCADGSCAIRVDEPSSIMFTGKRRQAMCRYCSKSNAPHRCGRCRLAAYCNKTCQTCDWKILNHKCICDL